MNWVSRTKALLARVHARLGSRAAVLMYHRIATCDIDSWNLCVSPKHFDQHLQVLRRSYHVSSLTQLACELRDRRKKKVIAITFDDGYADNLYAAAPALERYDAPATFFLTSGAVGTGREFWWDELERLLLNAGPLPSELQVGHGAISHVFKARSAALPLTNLHQQLREQPPWKADPDSRLGLYYAVWQFLRLLDQDTRQRALDAIRGQLNIPETVRDSHRVLTHQEVQQLASSPQCEIGAHSVTHPALSSLSLEAQRQEIQQSKQQLEQLLNRAVTAFAYPYGDYGPETASLVRASGFEFACTTDAVGVTRAADPYLLPRVSVEDCDGSEFARRLGRLIGSI
jgi:peptidoglycan/xylan/chitin deacetylase (PgdA/CDA1 family)